jgi:hypothetical protein
MRRLPDTPSNDNHDLIARVTRELLDAVRSKASDASFATRERTALAISNEAVRRALQELLQELADRDGEQIEIGVERYHRHQPGEVQYHSLCGALRVHRWIYRQSGVRNGPTVVPLDLRAGLIERATPALAYAVAQGYAKAPIRSVERDLHAAHREPPSRATLERMAKGIGTDAKASLMTLERAVRRSEEIPRQTRGITLGLDRTTVPMEEPRDDGTGRVVVSYRMAYVGTVALTDREGTVLKSWKYAGPAHEGPMQIVQRMMNDLRKTCSTKPRVRIGVVQDGAPELWGLMQDALRAEPTIDRWHEAIDMYHLMERLSKALEIVEPDETQRAKQLDHWRKLLLRDDGGIARIARFFELEFGWLRSEQKRRRQAWMSMGWMPAERGLLAPMPRKMRRPPAPAPRRWNAAQADGLQRLLWGYLANPRAFRYATISRLGLHVGSGVTEGACKSLIAARAKRGGQRWRKPGITAVLTLRSLVESERFDAFWKRFARGYAPLAHAA